MPPVLAVCLVDHGQQGGRCIFTKTRNDMMNLSIFFEGVEIGTAAINASPEDCAGELDVLRNELDALQVELGALQVEFDALIEERNALLTQNEKMRASIAEMDAITDEYDEPAAGNTFVPDFTVQPGDDITSVLLEAHALEKKTADRKARVLLAPGDHVPFSVAGIKHVHIKFDDGAFVNGMESGDLFLWQQTGDVLDADYPGLDLITWRANHDGAAYNNARMFPLLMAIDDEPLLWQPGGRDALQPGEFFVDSDADKPGRVFIRLPENVVNGNLTYSPHWRLMWGDDSTAGIVLEHAYFYGCSNPGKTGAVNFPGTGWDVRGCIVDLVNTIGIEFGQGGDLSKMRGQVTESEFIGVESRRAGQMGMWGAARACVFIDCGHKKSNWKRFDTWWEASHKFENTHGCTFIDYFAEDCDGPGFWFDGVAQDDGGGNTNNVIRGLTILNCVRSGLELELGTSNNVFENVAIGGIHHKVFNPLKPWNVHDGIIIKAFSNDNKITGIEVHDVENVVRINNDDARGVSDRNKITGLIANDYVKLVHVIGDILQNSVQG